MVSIAAGTTRKDVHCTRVDGSGSVHAGWPVTGVAVREHDRRQGGPKVKADGTGGAIVAVDFRRTPEAVSMLQRLNGSGAVQGRERSRRVQHRWRDDEPDQLWSRTAPGQDAPISTAATFRLEGATSSSRARGGPGRSRSERQQHGDDPGRRLDRRRRRRNDRRLHPNQVCSCSGSLVPAHRVGWGATGTNTSEDSRGSAGRARRWSPTAPAGDVVWIDNRSSTHAIDGNRVNGSGVVGAASGPVVAPGPRERGIHRVGSEWRSPTGAEGRPSASARRARSDVRGTSSSSGSRAPARSLGIRGRADHEQCESAGRTADRSRRGLEVLDRVERPAAVRFFDIHAQRVDRAERRRWQRTASRLRPRRITRTRSGL